MFRNNTDILADETNNPYKVFKDVVKDEIIPRLDTRSALNFAQTNKYRHQLVSEATDALFKRNLEIEFPHYFNKLKYAPNVDWAAKYKKAYAHDYACLKPKGKKIFTLVKRGDLEGVKTFIEENKEHDMFWLGREGTGDNWLLWQKDLKQQYLLDHTTHCHNQALKDYYFSIMIEKVYIAGDKYYETLRFSIGIRLNQPKAILDECIKKGADISLDTYLVRQCNFLHVPLHHAAACGNLEQIDYLLKNGAEIDSTGGTDKTALTVAAENNQMEAVKHLIKAGAKLNHKRGYYKRPLTAAVENQNIGLVKLLLEHDKSNEAVMQSFQSNAGRSEIDMRIPDKHPIHIAAEKGNTAIVEVLLNAGMNINAKTCVYLTPVIYAAKNGHYDTVKFLLERGASPKSFGWKSALDLAKENNHPEIAKLIQRHTMKETFKNKCSIS